MESMGVATGCGCKEVYTVDFLILLIPTPLVSVLFCSSIPTFCSFKKMCFIYILVVPEGPRKRAMKNVASTCNTQT